MDSVTKKMTLTIASKASFILFLNVRLQCLEIQGQLSLWIYSFQKGGDNGGSSECDNQYYSDDTPVVTLSIGWYSGGGRYHNNIIINGNGRSVKAMVIDECDSTWGVMKTTIISLHVLTILLMPWKLCGRSWVCLRIIGVS